MMGALYALAVLALIVYVLVSVVMPAAEYGGTDVLQALWYAVEEDEDEDGQ